MTAMALAVLTWDEAVAKPMRKIQAAFADCLPAADASAAAPANARTATTTVTRGRRDTR